MIIIKSNSEIDIMREAGKVTGEVLRELETFIKPGISTMEIDQYIENFIRKYNMEPAFKGLYGFPSSACISVNEEVVHGLPRKDRILKEGDIVTVDTGTTHKGYVSDAARTFGVSEISEDAKRLIEGTKASFFAGMEFCRVGYRLSDISHAIQSRGEADGLSVIREYVGHGIGRSMHEDPHIPNYGKAGKGPRLVEGMVFAIEPMMALGNYLTECLDDGWTVVTKDRSWAAQYENTVVVRDGEPELLTL